LNKRANVAQNNIGRIKNKIMKKSELKEFAEVTGFGASKKELLMGAVAGIVFLAFVGLVELMGRWIESF
jgi:hypothetical protein